MAGRRSAGRPVGLDYLGLIPSQPMLELGLGLSLAKWINGDEKTH